MPRDGSGVFSAPAGTTASPNTTIESAKYNALVADLVADANAARPITAGGTAATTAVAAADAFSTKATDIASAATTDIGAATGRFVHITGTTTITAFGTKTAGVERELVFDGILTLTHNATSLILPGATNIVTAADDAATFVSEGSGNWRCVSYQRAVGQANPLTLATPATASGTSVDFTSIPSWAKRINIMIVGISLSGTSPLLLQIGDSGGIEVSGYTGQTVQATSAAVGGATFSSGYQIVVGTAAALGFDGKITLDLLDPSINRWVASGIIGTIADVRVNMVSGYKSLTGTLDRVRLTSVNGTDTFDSGQVVISYE